MRFRAVFILAVVLLMLGCPVKAAPEHSIKDGMWICPTPADAVGFWDAMKDIAGRGVTVHGTIADEAASKSQCGYVQSDNLKPIDNMNNWWPVVKVADGKATGWVATAQYVDYMRYHVVRKPTEQQK